MAELGHRASGCSRLGPIPSPVGIPRAGGAEEGPHGWAPAMLHPPGTPSPNLQPGRWGGSVPTNPCPGAGAAWGARGSAVFNSLSCRPSALPMLGLLSHPDGDLPEEEQEQQQEQEPTCVLKPTEPEDTTIMAIEGMAGSGSCDAEACAAMQALLAESDVSSLEHVRSLWLGSSPLGTVCPLELGPLGTQQPFRPAQHGGRGSTSWGKLGRQLAPAALQLPAVSPPGAERCEVHLPVAHIQHGCVCHAKVAQRPCGADPRAPP